MYYEKFDINMWWLSAFFFGCFGKFISNNNLNYNDYQTINHIIIPYVFGKKLLVNYLINITTLVIGKKKSMRKLGDFNGKWEKMMKKMAFN